MAATHLTCGVKRALAALVAACGVFLVFAGTALAGNGNGNGCDGPGHHYGLDCDPPPPPPPPPAPPPSSGDVAPLPSDPVAPPADSSPSADPPASDESSPESGVDVAPPAGSSDSPEASGGSPSSGSPAASAGDPATPSADAPSSSGSGNAPAPPPPDPGPPAAVAGWAPLTSRQETPAAPPASRPTAPRGRTFSSTPVPDASRAQPDASWGETMSAERYGVTGTGAIITIRRRHGVFGGLSFRVSLAPGSSSLVFRAARSVVAGSGGRLYRIGAWLRTDAPGMSVCLRIQEVSPRDPLTAVRTSESCFAPTVKWKHLILYRRTLARGNKLVFSIYSLGAVSGDSFDLDRFTVARRVGKHLWKRVDAAFGDAAELR